MYFIYLFRQYSYFVQVIDKFVYNFGLKSNLCEAVRSVFTSNKPLLDWFKPSRMLRHVNYLIFTIVSGDHGVLIFGVKESYRTRCNISDDLNLYRHCSENLNFLQVPVGSRPNLRDLLYINLLAPELFF